MHANGVSLYERGRWMMRASEAYLSFMKLSVILYCGLLCLLEEICRWFPNQWVGYMYIWVWTVMIDDRVPSSKSEPDGLFLLMKDNILSSPALIWGMVRTAEAILNSRSNTGRFVPGTCMHGIQVCPCMKHLHDMVHQGPNQDLFQQIFEYQCMPANIWEAMNRSAKMSMSIYPEISGKTCWQRTPLPRRSSAVACQSPAI